MQEYENDEDDEIIIEDRTPELSEDRTPELSEDRTPELSEDRTPELSDSESIVTNIHFEIYL